MVTEKNAETADGGDEAESLKEKVTELYREIEKRDAAIIKMEGELKARDQQIEELQTAAAEAERTMVEFKESLAGAVVAYREQVIRDNSGVLADLISGENIEEINGSLKKATALIEKVKLEMEEEAARTKVPGGAPPRKPVPFDLTSEYGLAIAHHGDYAWLTTPDGVWRAAGALQTLDLTDDVLSVKAENGLNSGRLTVELRNDDGRYAVPGEGDLAVLDIDCQVEVCPGYLTAAGYEYSDGLAFQLEGSEYTSTSGKAGLVLQAEDGWRALDCWKARYQFRWNKASDEMNVKEMIAFVLARVGIRLEVISGSDTITGFCPDITINAGSDGRSAIRKLLSYVPDAIFIEGNKAYLVNPLPSDSAVYGYGTGHAILAGRYGRRAQGINSVTVEGYDTGSQAMVLVDSFAWDEIARAYERPEWTADRNIGSVVEAEERGQAVLRGVEMDKEDGHIIVPTNCGQQLTDVIEVTDSRAGLTAARKRITGITMEYRTQSGEYRQRLRLGAV